MTQPGRVGGRTPGRCVAHPALLGVDACPVCGRARCAGDVATFGATGCVLCSRDAGARRPVALPALVVLLRAGVIGAIAIFPGGWILRQYVNVQYMSVAGPAVFGLLASAVVSAAGLRAVPGRWWTLGVAVVSAVLGTALGFRLFGTPVTPIEPLRQVWLPYVASLIGAVAWPLLFGVSRQPSAR